MTPQTRDVRDDDAPAQAAAPLAAGSTAAGSTAAGSIAAGPKDLRVESDHPPIVVAQEVPAGSIDETELMRDTLKVSTSVTPPRDRRILAMTLLLMVGAIVISAGIGIAVVDAAKGEVLERALSVVFGPLVTLLGTSFTWYYASAPWRDEGGRDGERARDG